MYKILMSRKTTAQINNTPVTDGLINFDLDKGYIYLDNGTARKPYGGVEVVPNGEVSGGVLFSLDNVKVNNKVYRIDDGHVILNNSGALLTQRQYIKFGGIITKDDSTNEKTVSYIVKDFTTTIDEELGFYWNPNQAVSNLDFAMSSKFIDYQDTTLYDNLEKLVHINNDNTPSANTVYSSSKIEDMLSTNGTTFKSGVCLIGRMLPPPTPTDVIFEYYSVTFPQAFSNANYVVVIRPQGSFDGCQKMKYSVRNKTKNGFDIVVCNIDNAFDTHFVSWFAKKI